MTTRAALGMNATGLLGVALCLPIVVIYVLASNNIALPFAAPNLDPEVVPLGVRLVMISSLFGPLVALALNARGALRGRSINRVVAGTALALTVVIVIYAVVDQWNCFMGVPNCD